MKLDLKAVVALILAFVAIAADARITTKNNLKDERNLPKIDEDKAGVLSIDEDDYSGDYDDDEYYYDDDDYEEEEGSGKEEEEDEIIPKKDKEIDMILEVLKVSKQNGDEEFHFDEDQGSKDSDLLSEYYEEIYEEDYEDLGISDVESPIVRKKPTDRGSKETESELNYTNILMMVASGVISFGIFTLAFVLCCCNRRGGAKGTMKRKNLATVRLGSPEKTVHTVVRPSGFHVVPPPSSIVKNYHLVPQDAVEFLSTSSSSTQTGLENSSHILNEKKEPLLP